MVNFWFPAPLVLGDLTRKTTTRWSLIVTLKKSASKCPFQCVCVCVRGGGMQSLFGQCPDTDVYFIMGLPEALEE